MVYLGDLRPERKMAHQAMEPKIKKRYSHRLNKCRLSNCRLQTAERRQIFIRTHPLIVGQDVFLRGARCSAPPFTPPLKRAGIGGLLNASSHPELPRSCHQHGMTCKLALCMFSCESQVPARDPMSTPVTTRRFCCEEKGSFGSKRVGRLSAFFLPPNTSRDPSSCCPGI